MPSDGWKLVPLEPTEAMLHAAFVAMNETPSGTWKRMKAEGVTPRRMSDVKMVPRYRAMLAASPPPPMREWRPAYEEWEDAYSENGLPHECMEAFRAGFRAALGQQEG